MPWTCGPSFFVVASSFGLFVFLVVWGGGTVFGGLVLGDLRVLLL